MSLGPRRLDRPRGVHVGVAVSASLGLGHWITAPVALVATTVMAGLFGWIALRATGLGFLMITLALSQVLWGTAYRWAAVTNGDNGLSGLTRPAPFGISIDGPAAFYYFSLTVTVVAIWMMARFVDSPFGAALRGTRDQPRRMSALGHNVWLVRWLTFVYSGLLGRGRRPAVRLLPQVHPPDRAVADEFGGRRCSE